jgi:hypothetical protein
MTHLSDEWGEWPFSSRPECNTVPLSTPQSTGRRSSQNRNWQRQGEERECERGRPREERAWQREQEYAERLRQDAFRREEVRLEQQLRRLDAEEAAISAQWAALPLPPSPLMRILIALVVLGSIIALVLSYPILLVALIVVLLTMAKARRRHRWISRQRHVWARQERDRLESRWSGIVTERAVIEQQLASIKSELSQLVLP